MRARRFTFPLLTAVFSFGSPALLPAGGLAAGSKSSGLVADSSRTIRDSLGGNGAAFHLDSSILNQTRRIDVVLPASFTRSAAERRYPVIVLVDGELYLAPLAAGCDHLARHGMIPEAILVAIENEDPFRGRVHDLTPPGLSVSGSSLNEGGDRFLDFIEQELLTAIDRQFRGGPPRVIVGHSSGGVLATYAAATRPAFRAVVAIDAPIHLGGNWLAEKLIARAKNGAAPLRFAYYEVRFPWPEPQWELLVKTAPASWALHQQKLQREGHETAFLLGAYLGLREVFGDYSRLAAPVAPTTRILPHYATVGEAFGADLVPPRRVIRDVVEDFLMEGRGAAARAGYQTLIFGYGAPPDSADLLKQISEVERQPPPTETVEGLLATPFPTVEEARDYIGEWVGRTWMNPQEPKSGETILRIKVENGRVVAEMENTDAPEEHRIRPLEYLNITPAGLSFGFRNGMRPRGLILHEGVRSGDVLTGKTRWGGINFTYPPGVEPPDPGFSFHRRT